MKVCHHLIAKTQTFEVVGIGLSLIEGKIVEIVFRSFQKPQTKRICRPCNGLWAKVKPSNYFQKRFDAFLPNEAQALIFVSFYQEKEKSLSGQEEIQKLLIETDGNQ